MCGIAGIFGDAGTSPVEKMLVAMDHRGPDARGVWYSAKHKLALGNVRLSILDLSHQADMPMLSVDGRICITYNGEIYNFRELRKRLEQKGYCFKSDSDTEVVINAYIEWGKACLSKLNGMFAFALWDSEEKTLFLARDRFGIKPLYWYKAGEKLVFASELKGVLASGIVERRLCRQALWDYLSLGSVPPQETMIEGVYSLMPGHAMVVSANGLRIWRYWDIDEAAGKIAVPSNSTEILDILKTKLRESVARHMIADVEVGSFLSGGIDSSTITALAQEAAGKPLRTFSIGFEGERGKSDELPYAREVSELLGTNHEEYILNGEDVASEFDRIIWHIDQPSIDGVNTYFVSKIASRHVKVALTGLGGDELFAGYPHFNRFARPGEQTRKKTSLIKAIHGLLPRKTPGRVRLALEFRASSEEEKHAMIRRVYTEQEKRRVINKDLLMGEGELPPISEYYKTLIGRGKDPVQEISYIELYGYMNRMLLRDSDAMSMAHSIELRVPFLDHELAEYIYAIPQELKISENRLKFALKEIAKGILPRQITARDKRGFDLPMTTWLTRGKLRAKAEEILSSHEAARILSPVGIEDAMKAIRDGEFFMKPWSLVVLVGWLSMMGIGQ